MTRFLLAMSGEMKIGALGSVSLAARGRRIRERPAAVRRSEIMLRMTA